ncbi:MAG TPA: hypothetical protein VNE42_11665 [Acidimicrobiales bacterium]|nr:hypothetical protein [Acidimicrobiales bacterium]
MTVKITRPGEGETFPADPVKFRILEDGAEVDGRIGVVDGACQI